MDLQDLARFVKVADLRSFRKAAAASKVSQSTLSRSVQRLERNLGASLISRESASVELTPSGRLLYRSAQTILTRLEQTRADISAQSQSISGDLTISASTTPGEHILPTLLAQFGETHRAVRPKVFVTDSRTAVQEVSDGAWELGIVGARYPDQRLTFEALGEDEIVLAAPMRGRPGAMGPELTPQQLESLPFLDREEGSGTIKTVQDQLKALGIELPKHRVVMVLNNTQAMMAAVAHGYGYAWISARAIDPTHTREVRALRLSGIRLTRTLYLVYRRSLPLSPQARAFIQMCRSNGAGSPLAVSGSRPRGG